MPHSLLLSNKILKVSLIADEISLAHALGPGKFVPITYSFRVYKKEM